MLIRDYVNESFPIFLIGYEFVVDLKYIFMNSDVDDIKGRAEQYIGLYVKNEDELIHFIHTNISV